VNKIG